ncbi:hypothetical protein [Fontibacillus sp. BL9]|uniref:hypothetical protein n=1 Tax=Fontibacillus sp. BL9 TaxID=3389971 RepID=UPI003977F414
MPKIKAPAEVAESLPSNKVKVKLPALPVADLRKLFQDMRKNIFNWGPKTNLATTVPSADGLPSTNSKQQPLKPTETQLNYRKYVMDGEGDGFGGSPKKIGDLSEETGGTGKVPSQTLTSNKGNSFDVTPSGNHSTVTVNPKPTGGQPNSSVDIVDPKTGELLTRRWYGPDGRAVRDIDYTHHKNSKTHPEAPHEHTWTYDKNGNPSRSK